MVSAASPDAIAGTYSELFVNQIQAQQYREFRPRYPKELYDAIMEFAGPGATALAVDVATGSGQAIEPLAERFSRVIGIDGSASQLGNAPKIANIEYKVADAHDTGLDNGVANLVTVAQALHWFDRPKFYKEAARILTATGTLAAWTYDFGHINAPDSKATEVYVQLHRHTLGPYWAAPRVLVDDCYKDIEPFSSDFQQTQVRQFDLVQEQTIAQMVGYLGSWSAYHTYCERHPNEPNLAHKFQKDLLEAVGTSDVNTIITVTRQITLLLGKDPIKQRQ